MSFANQLNAGHAFGMWLRFIIPNSSGIVHTAIDIMAITQEPFTSHYGFKSTDSIAD